VDEGSVLEIFDTPLQRELAKQIALNSMVLLKNVGILPLSPKIQTLAVIGPNADAGRNQLGDYSYAAMRELSDFTIPEGSGVGIEAPKQESGDIGIELVSVLQGIQQVVSPQTQLLFAKGCEVQGGGQEGFAEAITAAEAADAVVLVLGDRSGLVPNCTTGEFCDCADLKLPGHQRALAEAIFAVGKPVAVVLINGRPYEIEWLDRASDAILEAWLPGEEGGTAVAETLFGLNNPGGKLPLSYPRSVGQLPMYYNHKKSGQFSNPYRNYVDQPTSPLYPFGHGLSYTEFAYRDFSISQAEAVSGDVVEVALMVHNIGPVAGDEVVQLYSEDEFASCPRPVKELRGYRRIHLAPGESKQVVFQLSVDQLAFINNALELVLEAGSVKLMVGSSSEEIHHTALLQIKETRPLALKDRVFDCPVAVKPCVVC
jgi:beta-glucosidase